MSSTYIHTKRSTGIIQKILKGFAIAYFALIGLSVLYICFIAHERYVSDASFKISRENSSPGGDTGMLELALPGMSESGAADSQVTIGYIQSVDLLRYLEEKFDLHEHYASPSIDFFFRLEKDAPIETRLDYYRSRIEAHFDIDTGLTHLTVDTFDPELSEKVAAEILRMAENFVNNIDQSIAEQQLSFAEREVNVAQAKVVEAHKELAILQNKHQLISPNEVISARLAAVQEMQIQKLRAEAELASLRRDSPGSPVIGALESKLLSLNELIAAEMDKLSGNERDKLNQILMEFEELELKLEFLTRLRTGAEMLLENNRVKAAANTRFFSIIQTPLMPEDAILPERGYVSITIVVLGLLLFLVLRALTYSVFDRN